MGSGSSDADHPLDRRDSDVAHVSPRVITRQDLEPALQAPLSEPVRYSMELARRIGDLYTQGMGLAEISKQPGMPRKEFLYQWHRDEDHFRKTLDACRATRALIAEEEAIALGDPNASKDDVPALRLAVENQWRKAEVADPERYGRRTTLQGDASRPIVFHVKSFIPDPEGVEKVIEHVVEPELLASPEMSDDPA